MTDDDSLPFWERKRAQVEAAPNLSVDGQHIRVADKISNLRVILSSPPEHWSPDRKLGYYAWAQEVVSGCTLASEQLHATFHDVHTTGVAALTLLAGETP